MIGERVADLELSGAWLVDPTSGRMGPGDLIVTDGVITAVEWREGADANGLGPDGLLVAPGFIDLRAHLREPGDEDAETIASGLAAAARGGFTTVCAAPDTAPALDEPSVLARISGAAAASGSPVRLLAWGAATARREGSQLAVMGELADAGVAGFTDDPHPIADGALLRNALAYAGMLGLPLMEGGSDAGLVAGAEASEGLIATVLGLRGAPVAAEVAVAARAISLLREVLGDAPWVRLHLAHLSTRDALAIVRAAKADGLPVTCDVAPHHLALSDEWLAGARRWAWDAVADDGSRRDPWRDGALVAGPYASELRVEPPLRSPVDAVACLAALADGTADAVATDHGPRTPVERELEFGMAPAGIPGLETAVGVLLAAVDAGRLPLARAIAALTTGPAAVLGPRLAGPVGLTVGAPADLVVIDRSAPWTVAAADLASKDRRTPFVGRTLPARVLLTVAAGRIAWQAPADA